jgi:hypothetical protein
MKKILMAILSVVLIQNVTLADSERLISTEQLPAAAQKLIKTYFGTQTVTYAKVDGYMFYVDYEVRLSDGTTIEFDRKGNWTEVVLRQDGVPAELVPAQITQYFNNAHPGAKVVKIEREARSYEVTLSNGFEYTFNKKFTLRGEAQYLHTDQDQGDWWYGLLELSVLPNFMFTISDMYNAHVPNTDETATSKQHYYMFSGCYTYKAHRLQLSYGKTRAGYNCSGGVCRYVPASKGVQISYNFNF